MATNYDVLLEKIRALGMDHRWAGMFVKKLHCVIDLLSV